MLKPLVMVYRSSVRYIAAKIWNDIPKSFKEVNSVNDFKSLIQTWPGFKCKCAQCKNCDNYYFKYL